MITVWAYVPASVGATHWRAIGQSHLRTALDQIDRLYHSHKAPPHCCVLRAIAPHNRFTSRRAGQVLPCCLAVIFSLGAPALDGRFRRRIRPL